MPKRDTGDRILRAVTDKGSFRALVARTAGTVGGVVAAQQARGALGQALGDLVTGTILFRELMAPTLRAESILEGAGDSGRLVADSHPDGATRGLVVGGSDGRIDLGEGAVLRMAREMPRGGLQEGFVQVPAEGGLTAALTRYLHESEQVVAAMGVATLLEGEEVLEAGGFVVQLLPEADRAHLAIMTERLTHLPALADTLRAGLSPEGLLEELLGGFGFTIVEERPVSFRCQCSQARVERSLITLDPGELRDLVARGEPLTLRCEYCRHEYEVAAERLLALIRQRGSIQ